MARIRKQSGVWGDKLAFLLFGEWTLQLDYYFSVLVTNIFANRFQRTRVVTVIFHSRNVPHRKRHQKHFKNEMGDDFCWYLRWGGKRDEITDNRVMPTVLGQKY